MAENVEGSRVPDFALDSDAHGRVTSEGLLGQAYVLYFYPKDGSGSCTDEAIAFSQALPAFRAKGAFVAGISPDSIAKHANFRRKYALDVPLLSDPDLAASKAFGVWVEKQMYGRAYMGVERATFLVDATGYIRRVWRKVRVDGHVEAVLEALETTSTP